MKQLPYRSHVVSLFLKFANTAAHHSPFSPTPQHPPSFGPEAKARREVPLVANWGEF
jgi:hypothetical protein